MYVQTFVWEHVSNEFSQVNAKRIPFVKRLSLQKQQVRYSFCSKEYQEHGEEHVLVKLRR